MSINYELLGRCLSSRISNYSNYNFFTLGKSFINYVDNDDLHFKYEGEIIDYIEYTCKSLMIGTEYVYSFIEWFMDEFDTDIKSSIKLSILGAHNSAKLTFRVIKEPNDSDNVKGIFNITNCYIQIDSLVSDESGAGKALLKEFISNLPYIPIYLEVKDLLYYSDDNSKLVDYFSNFGFVDLSDYVDELDLHPINSKIPMLLVSPYNKCLKNIDKYSFIKNIQKNVDDMNLF